MAKVIANTTSANFTQINATVAGKKDMEAVIKQAQNDRGMFGKKTILFIDEIHRFNKGQQDYLLPDVYKRQELGLQTMHERTARYIRRGYPLSCFEDVYKRQV